MILLALVLGLAVPVAILPLQPGGVPPEAAKAAEEALARGLPEPFVLAPLDPGALREHLLSAGPGCRNDLLCLCGLVPFAPGAQALDLELARVGQGYSADLALVAPCEGLVLDRRAALVGPTAAALVRFVAQAEVEMLRGRDLAPLRYGDLRLRAGAAGTHSTAQEEPDGFARLARGDYRGAEIELSKLLAREPANVVALTARGRAWLGLGNPVAALDDFTAAQRSAPILALPLVGMAEALLWVEALKK